MKIKTMTASFGRLERATLTLDGGLNIIQAQNEGGKSTWAGFLKAMLYGIDTRDRDRKGHLADKNRYQPWSGAPMEGEMTVAEAADQVRQSSRRYAKRQLTWFRRNENMNWIKRKVGQSSEEIFAYARQLVKETDK